jgi:TolB-like protein
MNRSSAMRAIGLAALLSVAAGCGSSPKAPPVPAAVLQGNPVVLMLPLSNLSGRDVEAEILGQVLYTELGRTGTVTLVDRGEADRLVLEQRLRDTGSPTPEQIKAMAAASGARYVMTGTVLEAASLKTPEGDIPSLGVTMRLIDAESGRPVWADTRFATGQDGESLFGWGREMSTSAVAVRLASEMFEGFRPGGPPPSR